MSRFACSAVLRTHVEWKLAAEPLRASAAVDVSRSGKPREKRASNPSLRRFTMKSFFIRLYASPLMLALRSLVIAPVAPMRAATITRTSQMHRISPSHRRTVVRSRD